MKTFFIDTEFNGEGGDLIAMALVPLDEGPYFYEVLECKEPVEWVAENVMPILHKDAITIREFRNKLEAFLRPHYKGVHIVADFPEDIKYFCQAILFGFGKCMCTPKLTFEINPEAHGASTLPHNALADARGNRDQFLFLRATKEDTEHETAND